MNHKKRKSLSYTNLNSAIRPVRHCDEVPLPVFTDLSEEAAYVIAVEPNVNDLDKDYLDYAGLSK